MSAARVASFHIVPIARTTVIYSAMAGSDLHIQYGSASSAGTNQSDWIVANTSNTHAMTSIAHFLKNSIGNHSEYSLGGS